MDARAVRPPAVAGGGEPPGARGGSAGRGRHGCAATFAGTSRPKCGPMA